MPPICNNRQDGIVRHTQPRVQVKNWCFTLNNYNDENINAIDSIDCLYVVYGKEVGENGTPHLQGTICFALKKAFQKVKDLLTGNPHLESTKKLIESITYCKKDGNFVERGEIPAGAGTRSDLNEFKEAVKANPHITLSEVREMFADVYATKERFCKQYINDHRPIPVMDAHPLRIWQQELNNLLLLPPDKRTVFFVVDYKGDSGKSWFAHHYNSLHDFTQVLLPGKKDSQVHVLSGQARVIFFDCPRSKTEHIQYDLFEELKNGYVFAQKYESTLLRFEVPHVVVMMNEDPDMTKLSRDRYHIIMVTRDNNIVSGA
jgi:hypothetical protein